MKLVDVTKMPPMQGRREREINIILVPDAQAYHEIKISTQEKNPMTLNLLKLTLNIHRNVSNCDEKIPQ